MDIYIHRCRYPETAALLLKLQWLQAFRQIQRCRCFRHLAILRHAVNAHGGALVHVHVALLALICCFQTVKGVERGLEMLDENFPRVSRVAEVRLRNS